MAFGGEEGENGDGARTWIESSTEGGIGVFMSGCMKATRL